MTCHKAGIYPCKVLAALQSTCSRASESLGGVEGSMEKRGERTFLCYFHPSFPPKMTSQSTLRRVDGKLTQDDY